MQVPEVLAPISGVLAVGASLAIVGVYLHGRSEPVEHLATLETVVPVAPEVCGALLVDLPRRPTWRSNVERIGRVDDAVDGREVWRELDGGGDRLDLVVDEVRPDRLVIGVARPEDIGIRATWTWVIEPVDGGSRIELSEAGAIENDFFRGWWSLRFGRYAAIEQDLTSFARALGAEDPELVRVR
jgi:hypothetical protein